MPPSLPPVGGLVRADEEKRTGAMLDKDIVRKIAGRILKDIQVELGDEFDKNFSRKAFFSEAWPRRKSPVTGNRSGSLLVDTGSLRRSVRSSIDKDRMSIRFFSDLAYAAIHNEGGEIVVTRKMQKFFWAMYYNSRGAFGRRKNGSLRQDKRNARLSTEADFWRAMALKKVGSTIKIPRRQFLGASPEVEGWVREIIEDNLGEYFSEEINFNIK